MDGLVIESQSYEIFLYNKVFLNKTLSLNYER